MGKTRTEAENPEEGVLAKGTEAPAAESPSEEVSPQQENVPEAEAEGITTTIILNDETREGLFQQVEELKAQHQGETLTVGAVGRKDDGTYEIMVDIPNSNT